MKKELVKDIVDWDVVNWSKALRYWERRERLENKNLSCLEIGSQKGGLSLWLAHLGNKVICSDLSSPEKRAGLIHRKYTCHQNISYLAINALNIDYTNEFDLITFKSILGGINDEQGQNLKKDVIAQIYKGLKPGGKLLFAENLEASFLHRILRNKFVKWGAEWNYLQYKEIIPLFENFSSIDFITVGFLGTFGRNEKQRQILGKLDYIFEKITPKKYRYIVVGIVKK